VKLRARIDAAKLRARNAWRAIKGDGCSAVPDWHDDYTECCNRHDADYRTGYDEEGRAITRRQADERLRACMKAKAKTPFGQFILTPLYFAGVRLFGRKHWRGAHDNT